MGTSTQEMLLENPLESDDILDLILPTPYDCCDFFPDVPNVILENSDLDKGVVDTSGLTINLSEMMADFAELISLDKAFELHQDTSETPLSELPSQNCLDNKKRSHDSILGEVWAFSPIPDHNYSFINQKRQKFDDSMTCDSSSGAEAESGHPAQAVVKTTKYLERRKKNNVASKRSRETRKNRFLDMEVQADELEKENEKLRDRIAKLERLTQQMKEALVKRLAK